MQKSRIPGIPQKVSRPNAPLPNEPSSSASSAMRRRNEETTVSSVAPSSKTESNLKNVKRPRMDSSTPDQDKPRSGNAAAFPVAKLARPLKQAKRRSMAFKKPSAISKLQQSSQSNVPNRTVQTRGLNLSKASTSQIATGATGAKPKTLVTKVPPWDYKGKVAIMEMKMESYKKESQSNKENIESLMQRVKAMEKTTVEQSTDITLKSTEVTNLQQLLTEKNQEIERLSKANTLAEKKVKDLTVEIESLETISKQQRTNIIQMTCNLESLETEIKSVKILYNDEVNKNQEHMRKITRLENLSTGLSYQISELEETVRAHEMERRQLHNTVQELKGNIRVFCRVRPILTEESSAKLDHISFGKDSKSLELTRTDINESTSKARTQPKLEFTFDKVFCPTSKQKEIFDELSQLVQSSLDGYNVCIFAYGQTGSGKTFTMEGPPHITDFVREADNPELGMIPLAVKQIFDAIEHLRTQGWRYTTQASILEIYNEELRDLLQEDSKRDPKTALKLTNTKSGDTIVTNAKCVTVENSLQVYKLLKRARKNRKIAATCYNDYSSRSHCVFRLNLQGENENTGVKCNGTLNLVDLAGSERLNNDSSFEANRLRETKNINKSLSNLGNVIKALAEKAEYIPYRNSKLTHLLMNSLGGNSKTLLLVMVSPLEENLGETLNSLRFGTSVNHCQIGTASRKIKL